MAVLIALTAAGAVAGWGLPAMAQDPGPTDGPLCLLTADAMGQLVGVEIATITATERECAYSADPAERQIQAVLGVFLPDNTANDPSGDPLLTVRYGHPEHGRDTRVAGRPAWAADDGTWVDVTPDVLGVWLNTVFDDDPPPPTVATAIAEAITPLYLAQPRPTSTPVAGLPGRFPAELAGGPLDTIAYPADAYLQIVASMGPPGSDRVEELRAAITELGTTMDAVQVMNASAYDDATGASIDIIAIQAPGLDVTPLLVPAEGALVDFMAGPPAEVSIGDHELVHLVDAGGDGAPERWFAVDGDVLWVIDGPEPLVTEFMTALPPRAGR